MKKDDVGSGSLEEVAPEGELLKAEYSRRWYRQLGISGQVLFFMPFVAIHDDPPTGALVLFVLSVAVALIGSFWNWRCPQCNCYFGKRFFFMRHCPSCGVELVK